MFHVEHGSARRCLEDALFEAGRHDLATQALDRIHEPFKCPAVEFRRGIVEQQ